MAKIVFNGEHYQLVEDDGTTTDCVVWLEKSKANEKHPEGKPWIKLPKGNSTNRTYVSEDAFLANNVDGEMAIDVKTSEPRVLGTSGVKQTILKFLDEETAAEYTELVNNAVEQYKAAKTSNRKKKPEEMNIEELQAYIEALKNGTAFKASKTGPKSFMDMFTDEQYNRYNEILALAQENKANMPKAKRGPLTDEEKAARKEKRDAKQLSKAEELLKLLMAQPASDESIDDDDLLDD